MSAQPSSPPITPRVAVIGGGAFGRNHLRVYRELEILHPGQLQLAALIEPDPSRRAELAALYNIPAFASLDQALQTDAAPPINAASVCVPTIHHAAIAEQLLHHNIDVLIEKPFAATLAEADRLLSLARERDRILAVGHLERFNPAVTAAAQRITRPMFFEAHRLSIFTPRSLDVDVVLDLMIHDLDIVLSLTQSRVKEVRAVGLPVLSPKVDIANVRVEFDSGCVANFTASRVSTEQVRKLRLFQPHEYLSLDFARQELLTIKVDPTLLAQLTATANDRTTNTPSPPPDTRRQTSLSSRPEPHSGGAERPAVPLANTLSFSPSDPAAPSSQPRHPERSVREADAESKDPRISSSMATDSQATTHPSRGLSLENLHPQRAEPLRLELEDFLTSIRNRTEPRVTGHAGRAALALALEINQQIASHAHRAGLA